MNIYRLILRTIKKLVLSERRRLEDGLKNLESRQQEFLSLVSSRQSQMELEVRDLRDRVARLEGRYESIEESVITKLENKSLKGFIIRLLGRRK